MILTSSISDSIVSVSRRYIGDKFDYEKFNCVHFVRKVFCSVGVELPLLDRTGFPPRDFHLSSEEFRLMPIGHSIFFKKKLSSSNRIWTHIAIIISSGELIHCSRHFGDRVVVTPLGEFLEIYILAPKSFD